LNLDLRLKKNNTLILLDIIVTKDKQLRALMPMFEANTLIPLVEKERREFFKTVNPKRINKRILGNLKGRSLRRAKRLVNAALGNIPPESIKITEDIELGSLHCFEQDFVRIL
jgi:hypothetical protein